MSRKEELWTLIRESMQAFTPHYRDVMAPLLEEVGFQGPDWFIVFMAFGIEPEPITAARFHYLFPYGPIERQKKQLAETAEHGFLKTNGVDGYKLTHDGRYGLNKFYNEVTGVIASLQPLSEDDLERLASLLERVVAATAEAPEPVEKQVFAMSRHTDPGSNAPAIVRIDQYLTDLMRYRDDAHLAAWRGYIMDGRTWEAFTFVWQNEAHTAVELAEKLEQRGYTEDDYAASLAELAQNGWLSVEGGVYQITKKGQAIRDKAEKMTNKYFFVGWSVLQSDEVDDLEELLTQLKQALQAMAEPVPA